MHLLDNLPIEQVADLTATTPAGQPPADAAPVRPSRWAPGARNLPAAARYRAGRHAILAADRALTRADGHDR